MIEHPWENQAFIKLTKVQIEALVKHLEDIGIPILSLDEDKEMLEQFEEGLCIIKNKKKPTVFDRIDEIDFGNDNVSLNGVKHFEYSWDDQNDDGAGYEKLDSENSQGGGHHYAGVYHPNVYCETINGDGGPGVCKHCGCTLF
jgi:hypothetical protein